MAAVKEIQYEVGSPLRMWIQGYPDRCLQTAHDIGGIVFDQPWHFTQLSLAPCNNEGELTNEVKEIDDRKWLLVADAEAKV